MGCGASANGDFKALGVVPRQPRGTTPHTPLPSSPLPEAFRQCSTPARGSEEERALSSVEISDMLSDIKCCVEDETDFDECREGDLQLKRKAEVVSRLAGAQDTGDLVLLRAVMAEAAAAGVAGLTLKLARRCLTELEIEASLRAAMRCSPKNADLMQKTVDQATGIRYTSRLVVQACAWLSQHSVAEARQKQVMTQISELLGTPWDQPDQLSLTERAVHAAQYAKVHGSEMKKLMNRRRLLRERAIEAESALEGVLSLETPRDTTLVNEALQYAIECEVPQSARREFTSQIALEDLANAIEEHSVELLRKTLSRAAELELDHEAVYTRATELLFQITEAPRLAREARELRVKSEREHRESIEQKRLEKLAKKHARVAARRAAREAKRAEKLRAAAEQSAEAARIDADKETARLAELRRNRPMPSYPMPKLGAPAEEETSDVTKEVTTKKPELEIRRPAPKFPTGDWLDKQSP